jgi:alpha-D-ribose 1-methylphosphonate 5-triphosphate synthase subunit PhnG
MAISHDERQHLNGNENGSSHDERIGLMRICAYAHDAELERAVDEFGAGLQIDEIRAPQTGLVMLKGRIGGTGSAFNAGEATVTRAVISIRGCATGYSWMLGRSAKRARLAAIVDALGQNSANLVTLNRVLVEPVSRRLAQAAALNAEQVAATRVDFFTLVRGEDERT